MLAIPPQTKAAQRQFWIDVLDSFDSGATIDAGRRRDDDRGAAELRFHAAHQALDHVDVAPEQTGLHGADGVGADHPRRLADIDPRQLRGALEQRVRGNLRTGTNTPPRYSPFADTASKVVAVPKSITMIGRPSRR